MPGLLPTLHLTEKGFPSTRVVTVFIVAKFVPKFILLDLSVDNYQNISKKAYYTKAIISQSFLKHQS